MNGAESIFRAARMKHPMSSDRPLFMPVSRFIACEITCPAMNQGLRRAVVLSLLVHAALLVYVVQAIEFSGTQGDQADARRDGKTQALIARLAPAPASVGSPEPLAGAGEFVENEQAADEPLAINTTEPASAPPMQERQAMANADKAASAGGAKVLSTSVPEEDQVWRRSPEAGAGGASSVAGGNASPVALDPMVLNDSMEALAERLTKGTHRVRLLVDPQGRVLEIDGVEVGKDAAGGAEEPVLTVFAPVRFAPARIGGRAVSSWITIEVDVPDDAPRSSRSSDRRTR